MVLVILMCRGSDVSINRGLITASGLSIDYAASKLYWISSGNGTINRCNLDGSGLEVLGSARVVLTKATALAVMGESGVWGP